MKLKVKLLSPFATLPQYQSGAASGFDLHSARDGYIHPGDTVLIDTGLAIEIPPGYELQIRPRSGMSAKTKVRVAFGTIDQDYRGELKVIADNIGTLPCTIKAGERIAQAVLVPVTRAEFELVEELGQTERGAGAFGSTGK